MPYYFAFAANMDRHGMAERCPDAEALCLARLDGWRYVITGDGMGAAVQADESIIQGVLWQCSDADMAALDAFESVEDGLYSQIAVPVQTQEGPRQAIIYVSPNPDEGTPRPDYQELVLAAARDWQLPDDYIAELEGWLAEPS